MRKIFVSGGLVLALCTMAGMAAALSPMDAKARPEGAVAVSSAPVTRPDTMPLPDLRWDHVAGSEAWTRATMAALEAHGGPLVDTVPADIAAWCPAYPQADRWQRKAFWAGLLSTLAKHESTYRPRVVGGDGKWVGLVQILPATARGYACNATTREALMDGGANMSCAVRILATTVPRDGVVSAGMKGVAADWGPFHQQSKREDMRQWVQAQPFCATTVDLASVRPQQRQDGAKWMFWRSGRDDARPVARASE
jgi:hypothetical protein